MTNQDAIWTAAKASAVQMVRAPGPKFFVETAYQADGSRVVRTKCHGDGYVTVCGSRCQTARRDSLR